MSDHNNSAPKSFSHEKVETNNFLLIVLTLLVVAVGGMVEIVPLFFQKSTTEAVAGLKPYTPRELVGRDVFLGEGCYNCHSAMIRPLRGEAQGLRQLLGGWQVRLGPPLQGGFKGTGSGPARVGGKYSDEWHRIHLNNPRD